MALSDIILHYKCTEFILFIYFISKYIIYIIYLVSLIIVSNNLMAPSSVILFLINFITFIFLLFFSASHILPILESNKSDY